MPPADFDSANFFSLDEVCNRGPRDATKSCGFRWYEVASADGSQTYTLHFYNDGGRRLAECTCKGHERGFVCYHVAAAASVHIGIAAMRRAA